MAKQHSFEGVPVKEMVLAVTGKSAEAPGIDAHHIGDEVTVLLVGTVTKVTHADTDAGLVRTHTVKLAEAHLLDEGEAGELLFAARDKDRALLDDLLGRRPLWDNGTDADPETGEMP